MLSVGVPIRSGVEAQASFRDQTFHGHALCGGARRDEQRPTEAKVPPLRPSAIRPVRRGATAAAVAEDARWHSSGSWTEPAAAPPVLTRVRSSSSRGGGYCDC